MVGWGGGHERRWRRGVILRSYCSGATASTYECRDGNASGFAPIIPPVVGTDVYRRVTIIVTGVRMEWGTGIS